MSALGDRLRWWRHAWFFEWAHKPLCQSYREDVLHLGKLHLCRGCTFLKLGLVAGLLGLLAWRPGAGILGPLFVAGFVLAALGSHPALHSRWPRSLRDLLRLLAGASLATASALSFAAPLQGALALGALASIYGIYRALRRSRRLERCQSCPELGAGVCSGYALQAEAIRAWEERATQRLVARGYTPR